LTLTGRMSLYRARVALSDGFIDLLQHDAIDHYRLGRVKFLTGDDKSTWYYILRSGREMLYVPDVRVITVEHPPHKNLFGGRHHPHAAMVRQHVAQRHAGDRFGP
jgi:glycosyltransferase Alg8